MAKRLFIAIIFFGSVFKCEAQILKTKHSVRMLTNEAGWYAGPTFQYELNNYSIGGEIKHYNSPDFSYVNFLFSWSQYLNYRRQVVILNESVPKNAIGLGAHVSFFSLETNITFGKNQYLWDFTPKLIADFGSINISYGYKIPVLGNIEWNNSQQHVLSLKYAIYDKRTTIWTNRVEEN